MEKVLLKKESLIGRRIGAFIIDQILISVIALIPFIINFNKLLVDFNYFDELFPITVYIGAVGLLFKDIFRGRSIGKLCFNIYVREFENENQTPKFFRLIIRNLSIFFWFIEFIVLLFDKEGRRLGDKLANTQVIGCKR